MIKLVSLQFFNFMKKTSQSLLFSIIIRIFLILLCVLFTSCNEQIIKEDAGIVEVITVSENPVGRAPAFNKTIEEQVEALTESISETKKKFEASFTSARKVIDRSHQVLIATSTEAPDVNYLRYPDSESSSSAPLFPALITVDFNNLDNVSKQRELYINSFRNASYSFNPPSPIKIEEPRTIHLWIDTMIRHEELAEQLKKLVPRDTDRIESGEIQIAAEMEAILTGEKFIIKANSPIRQNVNFSGRTIWSWDITPTWFGTQTLHLRLVAILPPDLGTQYTIPEPLDREIEIEVTIWWLIDHYWEKYWKWFIGGLGTLFLTVLGWWWKKHHGSDV